VDRKAATRLVLARAGDALIVSNLGSNTYDLYALGHRATNFYMWGAMGLAASVGLGLALALPARRVMVLDGDGSLLMNLGALATAAAQAPANLVHIVWVNGLWQETGGQPIATAGATDLAAIGRGAGLRRVAAVQDAESLDAALGRALAEPGPWLVVARVEETGSHEPPPVQPIANRDAFMAAART
jgi:thiamine pyrophosphate-dependent acetolactate synthase large subunit-like protein